MFWKCSNDIGMWRRQFVCCFAYLLSTNPRVFMNLDMRTDHSMDANEGAQPAEHLSPIPYKDRSTGLVLFGTFTILLGCLSGLVIPMMLIEQFAHRGGSARRPPLSAFLPAIVVFGTMAAALIWLGIGSIMARRWARALLLILSWSWLFTGVINSSLMMLVLPKILATFSSDSPRHTPTPPGVVAAMMVTSIIVFGCLFVLMPLVWTFFYGSRHVKATCEARDPVVRWTDACPLPVLMLSMWLAFSAPLLLMTHVFGHHGVWFFGMALTGFAGTMMYLIMAAVWGYAAWSLYKLKPHGWWIIFIAMCVLVLSSVIPFSTHDTQIAQIEKTGLFAGFKLIWLGMIWIVPFFGYLWYVRRFLFRKS